MIPEIEEIDNSFDNTPRIGYNAKCPRCPKETGLEASPGAALFVLGKHMMGH